MMVGHANSRDRRDDWLRVQLDNCYEAAEAVAAACGLSLARSLRDDIRDARSALSATGSEHVVISFDLPSTGERWNWPLESLEAADVFCELLDRADIGWSAARNKMEEAG